jgi:hypothetical protein
MKRQIQRVTRGPAAPPPLPKEVVITGPRERVDRFGNKYDLIWNGQRGDPDLRDLHPNEGK